MEHDDRTPIDITQDVLAENQFNDPPAEDFIFAGFPVEMTLASANKESLSSGFNLTYEIVRGESAAAHNGSSGVFPDEFDAFAEVFVGGTITGTVCVPIPIGDLGHPDTRVALKFDSDSRSYFG